MNLSNRAGDRRDDTSIADPRPIDDYSWHFDDPPVSAGLKGPGDES